MVIGTKKELLQHIGESLRAARLRANLTQATVCERSGIGLTALKRLENGRGGTLGTFVQVCRPLNRADWINTLAPEAVELSPIAYADALKKSRRVIDRRRASPAASLPGKGNSHV